MLTRLPHAVLTVSYNLTQYGNKSDLGFRFYPEVGRVVEATDSVCAIREVVRVLVPG